LPIAEERQAEQQRHIGDGQHKDGPGVHHDSSLVFVIIAPLAPVVILDGGLNE